MKIKSLIGSASILMVALLLLAFSGAAFGQGSSKGKGKSADKGNVTKADKGVSSDKAKKVDIGDEHPGKGKGSDRYDDDDYDRGGKGDRRNYDKTSRRFNGLAKKIGMSPERAQDWYERERDRNPDLTYGQFVAVNMIARKHGERHPRLTAEAIFRRMRDGENLGQAVKSLGLKDKDFKKEKKRINRDFEDYDRSIVEEIVDRYIYKIGW